MTNDDDSTEVETAVGRRALFRGGAALAGAAGITVIGASLLAEPAAAATNDPLSVGNDNTADAQTSLTLEPASTLSANGSGQSATLALTNENGPSLYLNPADNWDGNLEPGQILNTTRGPLVGVARDDESFTSKLLTEQDVWWPLVFPTPIRVLDTRTEEGRQLIMLPSPLKSDGRLPARTELTLAVAPTDNGLFGIPALQVNLTVVHPAGSGHAIIYPGPERPETSTVNFTKGRTVANAAFVGTSIETFSVPLQPTPPTEQQWIVIKIYTTSAAWIVLDLSAAYATGFFELGSTAKVKAATKRPSPATLARRAIGKLH